MVFISEFLVKESSAKCIGAWIKIQQAKLKKQTKHKLLRSPASFFHKEYSFSLK